MRFSNFARRAFPRLRGQENLCYHGCMTHQQLANQMVSVLRERWHTVLVSPQCTWAGHEVGEVIYVCHAKIKGREYRFRILADGAIVNVNP